MTTHREAFSTIADLNNTGIETVEEPNSVVRRTADLSGGATMWQARLVLSTLDQTSAWAQRLRSAIREGNAEIADALLDAIYARNTNPSPMAAPGKPSFTSETSTTVLPPAPAHSRKLVG